MVPIGTEETVCRLVREYSDMLLRLACTRLSSVSDAEDAVQEVFLRLLAAPVSFRDAGHERAWLIRTTLHRASDIRRQAEKRNLPLEEAAQTAAPASHTRPSAMRNRSGPAGSPRPRPSQIRPQRA